MGRQRGKRMSPGSEWKLHIRSSKVWPPTDSFSSHDSLDHALAAACLLPAHEVAVRIEGPNGEQWDQAKQRVFSPSATDAKTKLAVHQRPRQRAEGLFPPPALSERRHRSLARRLIAVRLPPLNCTSPIRGPIRSVDQLDEHYKCSGCNLGKRLDTRWMVFASRTGRSDVAHDRYVCIAV